MLPQIEQELCHEVNNLVIWYNCSNDDHFTRFFLKGDVKIRKNYLHENLNYWGCPTYPYSHPVGLSFLWFADIFR